MKKLLLIFCCAYAVGAHSQDGLTTITSTVRPIDVLSGPIRSILVTNSGDVWQGHRGFSQNSNAGLSRHNADGWAFYSTSSSPALPTNNISSLAKDANGNIWIGSDKGLIKFDGKTFMTYDSTKGLSDNNILSVEAIGNQVYVGTKGALSRFDGTSFTTYTLDCGNGISSIKAQSSQVLWLICNGKLIEFNTDANYMTTSFKYPAGPSDINCIYIDSKNNKWLGTKSIGAIRYNDAAFENANSLFDMTGAFIPTSVTSITKGPNNGVFFCHSSNSSPFPKQQSGFTELLENGKVNQYFVPLLNPYFVFAQVDGSKIVFNNVGYFSYRTFEVNQYKMPFNVVHTQNFKTLDINQVKAGISNRSDMHWDIRGTGKPMYEVPKGSGKHSNFASALWIGGFDDLGELRGGAQTYRQFGGIDFWPGPLDTIKVSIDSATVANYDKIWKVSYTDINAFIDGFNQGKIVATEDMLTWPAHGTGNASRNLAPFVDYNKDGKYNPKDGDYPKIKGDQTLYFIYNDALADGVHGSTKSKPMGIEVQGMAYAYGCSSNLKDKPELAYTTFYDYKITNRSASNYRDVFVTMWSDVDLGYPNDDYIGTNVADNYGYAYNGDSFDEGIAGFGSYQSYPPAQGFNIVKGPIANVNDGIDNNNNGLFDEAGEDCKLNKLTYFNNRIPGVPLATTDPSTTAQYYNIMTGKWKDGTPFTCGGSAFGGTVQTNWAFPGDPNGTTSTDPSNTCGNWTESGGGSDRRLLLSSGPFTLKAGQMQEVEYAFVTSFDSSSTTNSNLLSVAKLKQDIRKVNAFYNQVNKPSCLKAITVGVSEQLKQSDFTLYPNPASSAITISSSIIGEAKVKYEIVDVLGKVVIQNQRNDASQFTVSINDLNTGIYFLRIDVNGSSIVKKFIKE